MRRNSAPFFHGAHSPRNTKPAFEGRVGVRQSRGISFVAVLILPENPNFCKSLFWRRRSFVRILSPLPAGCLQPERRSYDFYSNTSAG
jgi:hypothetical protein